MQIARKATFFLGIFIFLIPFLGFPSVWKQILTIASGVFLMTLSVQISISKKSQRPKSPKEKIAPVFIENTLPVVYPRNDTIEVVSQVVEGKSVTKKTRATKKNNGSVT